jgi:uncharacterized protein YcbK (DUF882 family)
MTGPYHLWPKGLVTQLSPNFKTNEFECRCSFPECREQRIHTLLLEKLELVRAATNSPITVTSGYRCSRHQAALRAGGLQTTTGTSAHELGHAADIRSLNLTLLKSICDTTFKAVGTAPNFLHVDIRSDKIRRWSYV